MKGPTWQQVAVGIAGSVLLAFGGCGQFLNTFLGPTNPWIVWAGVFVVGVVLFCVGFFRLVRAGVPAPVSVVVFVVLVLVLLATSSNIVPSLADRRIGLVLLAAGAVMILWSFRGRR